jgi:hypothetical protein
VSRRRLGSRRAPLLALIDQPLETDLRPAPIDRPHGAVAAFAATRPTAGGSRGRRSEMRPRSPGLPRQRGAPGCSSRLPAWVTGRQTWPRTPPFFVSRFVLRGPGPGWRVGLKACDAAWREDSERAVAFCEYQRREREECEFKEGREAMAREVAERNRRNGWPR